MVIFSHLDTGTDEETWIRAFASRNVPLARLDVDGIVVVGAHPDDESLGVAGFAHAAAREGVHLEVIVATNGERSHPDSPTHSPRRLARLRRREVRSAISITGALVLPDVMVGIAEASATRRPATPTRGRAATPRTRVTVRQRTAPRVTKTRTTTETTHLRVRPTPRSEPRPPGRAHAGGVRAPARRRPRCAHGVAGAD